MKSPVLLLFVSLLVSTCLVRANWFGKREKDDAFRQYLAEKLSQHASSAPLSDRAFLTEIARLLHSWEESHADTRADTFKKMA